MTRTANAKLILAERLVRPQRIGLFGQRGVGKTTLLTMLYRQAVGGRLPGPRSAAADARTANYLSDKILQLETGQALPATLAETELRFHLYHQGRRIELLVKDYQGEHVALGREEPIRDFLRDCDAVWLCLDAALAAAPQSRLQAQQEAEQMLEDYLGAERQEAQHRPTAFVLTTADLLTSAEAFVGPTADAAALADFIRQHFNITNHALASHCPECGNLFAVSSLGEAGSGRRTATARSGGHPGVARCYNTGSGADLRLRTALDDWHADKAVLETAMSRPSRAAILTPATAFAMRRRLDELRRRTWQRRVLGTVAAAACLHVDRLDL